MKPADRDSPTKQKLLDAAQELMRTNGYAATSVDDVCEAAGLTKGSFFHYFESKEHLGREVAERYFSARKEMFQSAPFRGKKDPLERVFGYVDFLLEMARHPEAGKGCLLGTFAQELSDSHPGIRSVCAACFDEQCADLRRELEEAKAAYAPRARWSPQTLAEHLVTILQGALILAKARQDPKVLRDSLHHFKEYLKCLFGR
jgi:TetR/AcrR family transcriptional regulator, transcriptional repressor for nem operon